MARGFVDKKHLVETNALPEDTNTPMPIATLHAVNEHSMTEKMHNRMEIAYFAMGCFWGVEAFILAVPAYI